MKTCGLCEGCGSIYAGSHMTWEGPVSHWEVCEACHGTGEEPEEVTSEDWADYAAMMQADWLEACAETDRIGYGRRAA